jgi:hypothetical protein
MNSWQEFKNINQLDTGDILLFHHHNDFSGIGKTIFSVFTDLIMWATGSMYSHTALIIKDPKFTNPPLKGLYILESSWENFPDVENHEYKLGVELEEFEKVMDTYKDGQVYWRKLDCTRDDNFYEKLEEAHSVVHNRPYDVIPSDWIKAALHINKGNVQKKKTFWCSALVAYIYTYLGFLPENTPWTLVSPKMLGTESPDKHQVSFQNCTVEKEVIIQGK